MRQSPNDSIDAQISAMTRWMRRPRSMLLMGLSLLALLVGLIGLSPIAKLNKTVFWLGQEGSGQAQWDRDDAYPVFVELPPPQSASELEQVFARYGYHLDFLDTGDASAGTPPESTPEVPRLFVKSLPPDLDEVVEVSRRKSLFIRTLLPVVLAENERLLSMRQRLMSLRDQLNGGGALDSDQLKWLKTVLNRYKVRKPDLEELIRRVDAVPPSLALAQAAVESGWGTSRFALEGNALYGQWTWSRTARGIVPKNRAEGKRHRIRAFDSLAGSVRAYMHAVNASWAYRAFRAQRVERRTHNLPLDGLILVDGLRMYSQERGRYTTQLRQLIASNDFHQLDRLRLQPHPRRGEGFGSVLIALVTP